MLLIPAIDLKDGRCVRLRQGRMEDETVFDEDPVAVARRWVDAGGQRVHIVDLDGAFAGQPRNLAIIRDMVDACGEVPVQVGGGIRDEATIEAYLSAGVQFCIVGSQAVREPHFVAEVAPAYPGHIIVGLDAKEGKVATDGWSKLSKHDVIDLAQHFENDGVAAIVYTDISKDGMMEGIGVQSTQALARAVSIPVIASGGVASLEDIRTVCQLEDDGVSGVIIGRALYEGSFTLEQAQALVDA